MRELPKGWARATLGDLRQDRSQSLDPSRFSDEDFELYSVPRFDTGIPEVVKGRSIGSTKRLVEPDTVLICKINPRINRAWRVGDHSPCRKLASTEWIPFFPCAQVIPDFLRYFLSQNSVRNHLAANVSGVGGSLMRVRPGVLDPIAIALPPIDEQERIVAKIDELFARLDAAEREIAKAEQLAELERKSLAWATFSCAKTVVPFEALISDGPANGYSPKSGKGATGTSTLKLSATTSGRFLLNEHTTKRIHEEINEESDLWLVPGDLLIQRSNTIEYVGTAAIFDGPERSFIYPDLMMRVRLKDKKLNRYVWRYLNSPAAKAYIRAHATGTAGNMPKVNSKVVRGLPIPLHEEEKIPILIAELDTGLEALESMRETLTTMTRSIDALRQSVLATAFRGELVPQDASDEPAEQLLERLRAQRIVESAPVRVRNGKRRVHA